MFGNYHGWLFGHAAANPTALALTAGIAACTATPSTAGGNRAGNTRVAGSAPAGGTASRSATHPDAPSPVSGAECLIGTWRVTSASWWGGLSLTMTAGSQVNTFRSDGTGSFTRTRETLTGKIPSGIRTIISTGTGTFTYHASNGEIVYSTMRAPGTVVTEDNGVVVSTQHVELADTSPDFFACSGDTLTFNDRDGRTVFARVP